MLGIEPWLDAHAVFWPLFIFLARVTDVSIGTMRTIFVVRGHRMFAAMLGFVEVIIWIVAASIVEVFKSIGRERTRREIAAYIAEGSMTPDQGERLLRAGEKNDEA